MTLQLSDTEKRAGMRIAYEPDQQPRVAPTGPASASKAARARPLDAGTPR